MDEAVSTGQDLYPLLPPPFLEIAEIDEVALPQHRAPAEQGATGVVAGVAPGSSGR